MKPAGRQRPPRRGADASINNPKTPKVARRADGPRRPILVGSDVDTTRRRLFLIFDLGRDQDVRAEVRWLLIDAEPVVTVTGTRSPTTADEIRVEALRLVDYFSAMRHFATWIEAVEDLRSTGSDFPTGWARRWSA